MTTIPVEQVISARVRLPLRGAWVAELVLDAPDVSGAVEVDTGAGGLVLFGTVVQSGTVEAVTTVRVVGGAGGLSKAQAGKDYSSVPVSVVLADLCAVSGETLSSDCDPAILAQELSRWTTKPGRVVASLDELIDRLGCSWRILPDGSLWIGSETWPIVSPPFVLVLSDPAHGRLEIVPEALTITPGVSFAGHNITDVEHTIQDRALRSALSYGSAGSTGDRLKAAFGRLVGHYTSGLDRFALYPAEVVTQDADGLVSVRADDARLPPVSGVPIRHGIPGVTVEVEKGARVLLGFDAGQPDRPFVALWNSGGLKALKIEASGTVTVKADSVILGDDKDARPVARIGDAVQLVLMPSTPVVGTLSGAPFAGALTLPGTMFGVILAGAKNTKAS